MINVSIIVPIYNVEAYIERCLYSLINQTLQNIEIILVEDGSPDSCALICDKYAQQDSRIKVIHKKNEGLGFARNSGLAIAKGEYIAFVDSDDYVDLSMYESLYKEAIVENADVVFCRCKKQIGKNVWRISDDITEKEIWSDTQVKTFMYDMIASAPNIKAERKYTMSVWHSIYNRTTISKYNLKFESERTIVSEDLPFQVDFLLHSKKVVYLPQAFYYYCLNTTSLSNSFKLQKFIGFKKLRLLLLSKLSSAEYQHRVDRLFIGYCRIFLIDMLLSNLRHKYKILNEILNDVVWIDIKKEYKPVYLPFFSRIFYKAILSKNKLALCYYAIIYKVLKETK